MRNWAQILRPHTEACPHSLWSCDKIHFRCPGQYLVCWYCSPGDRLRYPLSCLVHWENFKTQYLLPIADTETSLKNLQVTFLPCKLNDLGLHSWLDPCVSCGTGSLTQCCEGRGRQLSGQTAQPTWRVPGQWRPCLKLRKEDAGASEEALQVVCRTHMVEGNYSNLSSDLHVSTMTCACPHTSCICTHNNT